MTHSEVANALTLTVRELWSLSSNRAFPKPVGNDDAGNVIWNESDIAGFALLWNAARAHGWKLTPAIMPSADFAAMAAAAPGAHYQHAHASALFD